MYTDTAKMEAIEMCMECVNRVDPVTADETFFLAKPKEPKLALEILPA